MVQKRKKIVGGVGKRIGVQCSVEISTLGGTCQTEVSVRTVGFNVGSAGRLSDAGDLHVLFQLLKFSLKYKARSSTESKAGGGNVGDLRKGERG